MKKHPDTVKLERLKSLLHAFVDDVNAELALSSREQIKIKEPLPEDTQDRGFTTFEVAKLCAVFHTTVIGWANRGKLKVRMTPGGHRRFAKEDVLKFMQVNKMKIPSALK